MTLVLDAISRSVAGEVHSSNISLTLERGTLNVLLGPTLSGKTSLMRLMAGLDKPDSGRLSVDGRDVTGVPVGRRNVAMVYQQFINYPTLSVFENIASPLRVARLDRSEIDSRVRDAARLLRLEPMLDRTPAQLSGGQQQRTAIARALVKRADLVLMDEPLANLDYKLREELREELPKIFASSGAIFVYATTEPSEALLLGGNTATLSEGRVTQFGPTPHLYRDPFDLATAEVFSDPPLNTLTAEKRGSAFAIQGAPDLAAAGLLARLGDGRYTLGFRAHHLELTKPVAPALEIAGTVSVSEITGSESFIHLAMRGHNFVALTQGIHRLEIGEALTGYVDPAHLFAFDPSGRCVMAPASVQGGAVA